MSEVSRINRCCIVGFERGAGTLSWIEKRDAVYKRVGDWQNHVCVISQDYIACIDAVTF